MGGIIRWVGEREDRWRKEAYTLQYAVLLHLKACMDEGSLKGDVRWEERKKKQERGGGETYKYLELRGLS